MKNGLGILSLSILSLVMSFVSVSILIVEHFDGIIHFFYELKDKIKTYLPSK